MKCNVVFTADNHGNISQFKKTLEYARKSKAAVAIFGGDLFPKDMSFISMPGVQKFFFFEELLPLLSSFHSENPYIKIYLMMGNDDALGNLHEFINKTQSIVEWICDDKKGIRKKINVDFDIAGFSFLPPTQFLMKDWEFMESKKIKKGINVGGFVSTSNPSAPWKGMDLELKPNLKEKIDRVAYTENPEKLVFVAHYPPRGLFDFQDTGSQVIREYIDTYQPLISLHGHIHHIESTFSDRFFVRQENTIVASVFNSPKFHSPYIIEFDLYNIAETIMRFQV
ncbi:metallophosphoesterase [Candidatus Micrarchaeota archaeon]|nr:metallophosphoesterase [Candidatus Micrarchaeota archaeon]